MQTVRGVACAEYEIKRSRFIGTVCGAEKKEDALDFIKQIKNNNLNATHNVYAYIVEGGSIKKSTDAGEPKGTAGVPILSVLCGLSLVNVAVVVTRYFGGILLGAGGLARAYSTTAKLAINNAKLAPFEVYVSVEIEVRYDLYNAVNLVLNQFEARGVEATFFDKVHVEAKIIAGVFEDFRREVLNVCSGEATIIRRDDDLGF